MEKIEWSKTTKEEKTRVIHMGIDIIQNVLTKYHHYHIPVPEQIREWHLPDIRRFSWRIDHSLFDTILHVYGLMTLECVKDYFLEKENYEKCAEINRHIENHFMLEESLKEY